MKRLDFIQDWLDLWPRSGGLMLIVVGGVVAVLAFTQLDSGWNIVPGGLGLGLVYAGARTLFMVFTRGHAYPPYDRE